LNISPRLSHRTGAAELIDHAAMQPAFQPSLEKANSVAHLRTAFVTQSKNPSALSGVLPEEANRDMNLIRLLLLDGEEKNSG
jgi:hypothetical protein